MSGREAEALHAEEEDQGEGVDSDSEDPIQKIIQSRYYSLMYMKYDFENVDFFSKL